MILRLFFTILTFAIISCATKVTHGVLLPENSISSIMPNITRKEDVKNLAGSPSFIIKDVWYYATTTKTYRAFFLPKTVKHEIYAIAFENDTVKNIEIITEKDIENTKVPVFKIKTKKPNLKEIYNAN